MSERIKRHSLLGWGLVLRIRLYLGDMIFNIFVSFGVPFCKWKKEWHKLHGLSVCVWVSSSLSLYTKLWIYTPIYNTFSVIPFRWLIEMVMLNVHVAVAAAAAATATAVVCVIRASTWIIYTTVRRALNVQWCWLWWGWVVAEIVSSSSPSSSSPSRHIIDPILFAKLPSANGILYA